MTGRRLKLLLTADAVGGVWQYSLDLARGLTRLDVDVVIAVMGPSPSPEQQRAAEAIADVTVVDTGLVLDWLAPSPDLVRTAGESIAALASAHAVDLVQLHAPALAAEAAFDVPVVAVNHSCLTTWWSSVRNAPIDPDYEWRAALATKGLHAVDRVVAPSKAFAEATMRAHRLDTLPAMVHNGRTPLVLPDVASHDFAFTAGRLWDSGKNLATLDRAAAALAVPLYAAGSVSGPSGESVGFDHVHLLGQLGEDDLARWLAAKPVFVSAALYEPFGLAVLEAASTLR